ncbi:MAG: DUF2490 domain-containing protein [Bacteroidaceae bacterium]|nr:DUF2490 domain-containing protein [Bacteroidaceae bacterium]
MRKYFLAIMAFAATTAAIAQGESKKDDLGVDISIGAEKELLPNFDFSVEANVRTQEHSERIERYLIGGELGYKFLNTKTFDMKVSGGFEYMWQQKMAESETAKTPYPFTQFDEQGNPVYDAQGMPLPDTRYRNYNVDDRYWRNRHRTSLGLTATYSPNKRWSFQLKETVQYNHYCREDSINQYEYRWDENDDGDKFMPAPGIDRKGVDPKDRFILRSKFTVEYNVKDLPLNLFASVDYGCGLNYTANKWKYTLGEEWSINKKHKLTCFFRFQTEDDDDEPNGLMIGMGYKVKF